MKKKYLFLIASLFLVSPVLSQNCSVLCNSNFDSVQVTFGSNNFVDSTQFPCWRTTAADGLIEVWPSGFFGVQGYSGIQFIELNANFVSTVYQNITASPGTVLSIGFAHRGRWGVDTMSVAAGPVGGPYTTLGYFADDSSAWGVYSVNYTVPNMGANYSIRFNSVYAVGNNPALGNFLDSVAICATEPNTCNLLCNENFDSLQVAFGADAFVDSSQFPCWRTTSPDGLIEVWPDGFFGVHSYSGSQFIELNAYYVSTVYQNIIATPGTTIPISFAHRGRWGVDTMSVSAGPVGGPYITLGFFADDSSAWGYHTVNYIVPNLGVDYSIRFNSIYATGNNPALGNFLDAVSTCSPTDEISKIHSDDAEFFFPNPFENKLNIKCNEDKPTQLILYDVTSRIICNLSFTKTAILDTEKLAKGIYLYEVRNKDGVIRKGKAIKD